MANTLKDTMTTVKAELLGYKYITDFDYNTLFNMKLNYMCGDKSEKHTDVLPMKLVNNLLHYLTICCNVKKDDPSIFILLEGKGYKLLIDNISFKHLSNNLDTSFDMGYTNNKDDNLVIIHNSIIINLKSITYNNIVCISDSTIDVKHITSNTNNELLNISKCYIHVENELLYRKDEIFYRKDPILYIDNKKFTIENSVITAGNIVFSYYGGDTHRVEGYNIKCNGSKITMYLDRDNDKLGSKVINNTNKKIDVYLRKPNKYDDFYNKLVSLTINSSVSTTVYYGTGTAGWLVIKPNKEVDFIITAPKILNKIDKVLVKNKIRIPHTMSIRSAEDMLELIHKLIKESDDKEVILEASDIKITLTNFLKNGIEKLSYTLNDKNNL